MWNTGVSGTKSVFFLYRQFAGDYHITDDVGVPKEEVLNDSYLFVSESFFCQTMFFEILAILRNRHP